MPCSGDCSQFKIARRHPWRVPLRISQKTIDHFGLPRLVSRLQHRKSSDRCNLFTLSGGKTNVGRLEPSDSDYLCIAAKRNLFGVVEFVSRERGWRVATFVSHTSYLVQAKGQLADGNDFMGVVKIAFDTKNGEGPSSLEGHQRLFFPTILSLT